MHGEIIDDRQFLKQIKSDSKGAFLFFGDEDYTKNFCIEASRKAVILDESLALFNEAVFDGSSLDLNTLKSSLESIPFMADSKIVIVKRFRPGDYKKDFLDSLITLLDNPGLFTNTLFILSCSYDIQFDTKKKTGIFADLSSCLTPVCFSRATPEKLVSWIFKHFEAHGIQADRTVCDLLVKRCGTSMYPLSLEIDKLSFFVASEGRTAVTVKDLENISTKDVSVGAFDLSNALLAKRKDEALRVLQNLKFNRVDHILLLGQLASFFCDQLTIKALMQEGLSKTEIAQTLKIHEYRVGLYMQALRSVSLSDVENMVKACAEADAKVKQGRPGYEPLEYLVCAL